MVVGMVHGAREAESLFLKVVEGCSYSHTAGLPAFRLAYPLLTPACGLAFLLH